METELAQYAMSAISNGYGSCSIDDDMVRVDAYSPNDTDSFGGDTLDGDMSLYSIENQATSFDAVAARQSLRFMRGALREIGDSFVSRQTCGLQNDQVKKTACIEQIVQ